VSQAGYGPDLLRKVFEHAGSTWTLTVAQKMVHKPNLTIILTLFSKVFYKSVTFTVTRETRSTAANVGFLGKIWCDCPCHKWTSVPMERHSF